MNLNFPSVSALINKRLFVFIYIFLEISGERTEQSREEESEEDDDGVKTLHPTREEQKCGTFLIFTFITSVFVLKCLKRL